MPTPRFIHLHVHTEYSLVDSIVGIKPLMRALTASNMPAVALTDQSNLFALIKFYKAAQAAGIKPIIGAEVWVGDSPHEKKPSRLVLLCQNQIGYQHLTQLMSRAYLEGQHTQIPLIQKSWFQKMNAGLIALSGGQAGDIGQAILTNQHSLAESLVDSWAALFPDRFYLALQRTGHEHEPFYIQSALAIARDKQIPVVATNPVCFLSSTDFEAHEARVCIQTGFVLDDHRRPHDYTEQQYLRTEDEMVALFSDIPEALENTVEIAKRCNLTLTLGKSFLPNFPIPTDTTANEFFSAECQKGLKKRLQDNPDVDVTLYEARLTLEIETILKMEFPGYFLIVADFIRWSKVNDIPVGPGRGSGAGSLVAYALNITDLDPIQHDLLFERFLNPERVSMPDFDIDFCMEGRDRVIDYVTEKYGRASVAQIITYGKMAARAVIRDVGRVLGYPYGFVDKIAKLIPFELGVTLTKALKDEPQLAARYEAEDEVKTLIDLGMKLEGVPKSAGKHAGGVVISPSVLTDFTPLYCEPSSTNCVTQLDKNDVEDVGLVKFDFLGLRTLTIMHWAITAINARRQTQQEAPIDLLKLPLNDEAAFDLLKTCETTAIFQLESSGIKDLVRRLQPNSFDDIVALVALYRPGPLQSGMVDDFINRKHKRAEVIYPHPLLAPILRPTYGVILYQEQVMQIAQVMGGYTLGSADILRRAMGKKKPEEMAKQRSLFVNGAEQQGIDVNIANSVFNLMEMFADYGFNKSHSAAYALITYQTAWLKAHYPAEFMAAVLSSDMDKTEKVVHFIADTKKMGLTILPPNINTCQYYFTVSKAGEILYGLGAIKGVGQAAVALIIDDREKHGVYTDLFNFCQRLDTRKVNRKVLEALIRAGAMDIFETYPLGLKALEKYLQHETVTGGAPAVNILNEDNNNPHTSSAMGIARASFIGSIDLALKNAEQHHQTKTRGQMDLWGFQDDGGEKTSTSQINYVPKNAWSDEERLAGEKSVLGWYISGHPITRYEAELANFTTPIQQLKTAPQNTYATKKNYADKTKSEKLVTIAGYVIALRSVQTKSGKRAIFLTLDDRTAQIDVAVFSDVYEKVRELLVKDHLLIVAGEVSFDEYTEQHKFIAREVQHLNQAREKYAKYLRLTLHQAQIDANFFAVLKETIAPFCGGTCPIIIDYWHEGVNAHLQLGQEWQLKLTNELLSILNGFLTVKVEY